MSQTKTNTPRAKSPGAKPTDRRWLPIAIGGVVVVVLALVLGFSLGTSPSTTTTVPPNGTAGVVRWTGEVTLQNGGQYGLDSHSNAQDLSCSNCVLVEGVLGYGMAISDSGGLQQWLHGTPTYTDCKSALVAKSLPAAALYDPPAYKTGAKDGTYFCGFASDGSVLRLRYDGPINNSNAFNFDVTSWASG